MGGIRVGISEPCLVERFPRGWLGVFQAGDEFAVGAPCVAVDSPLKRSGRLEEKLFLLVENPREVCDLPGVEVADSDVNVLAGAFRSFRSGFAELAHHRLKGIHVVPFENRGHHLGACGTASEASIADRFPVASVRSDHRPFVVSASGVVDRPADHAVDGIHFVAIFPFEKISPRSTITMELAGRLHYKELCYGLHLNDTTEPPKDFLNIKISFKCIAGMGLTFQEGNKDVCDSTNEEGWFFAIKADPDFRDWDAESFADRWKNRKLSFQEIKKEYEKEIKNYIGILNKIINDKENQGKF